MFSANHAHPKENPLQHLAVVIWLALAVEPENMVLIIMLREVEQDRSGFEHDEVVSGVVNDNGKSPVWIELDKPGLL